MILQHLVWKNEDWLNTEPLYYHTNSQVNIVEDGLIIPATAKICFDTYFNAFVSQSWKQYTKLQSIRFCISVNGKGKAMLMNEDAVCVAEQLFSGKQEIIFPVDILKNSLYYLSLETQQITIIERGVIETDETGKKVKLALITCTYRREEEVLHNLRILRNANKITEDGERTLERIYVVDNAKSLLAKEIEREDVTLLPNRNTGGSGGYTRGIKEAMQLEDVTHFILMDDDVNIEFEAFRRTKSFLQFVNQEYGQNFLGGAMLRRDVPYLMHAAGEDWEDGQIRNPYQRTDLRDIRNVMKVSKPIKAKQPYAGWWYCCIPKGHILNKGYPMPYFLHVDDVEYSLRSGKAPIYLNGIAVWHEEFEDKRSSVMEYYDTRNRLITNAIYKEHGKLRNAMYIICERFYATVFRYRYLDFALSIKAAKDFLRGPEWLKNLDSETFHQSLIRYGYKMKETGKMPKLSTYPIKCKAAVIARYFSPASGIDVIRMGAPVSAYAGKKKVLLVDPKLRKGVEVKKSWRQTMICVGQLINVLIVLMLRYKKSERVWAEKRESN